MRCGEVRWGGGLGGKIAPARPTPPGGPGGNIAPARPTVMVLMTSTAKPKWSNTLVALMGKIFGRRVPGHVNDGTCKRCTYLRFMLTYHTIVSRPVSYSASCFRLAYAKLTRIRRCRPTHALWQLKNPHTAATIVLTTTQSRVRLYGRTHALWHLKNPTLSPTWAAPPCPPRVLACQGSAATMAVAVV